MWVYPKVAISTQQLFIEKPAGIIGALMMAVYPESQLEILNETLSGTLGKAFDKVLDWAKSECTLEFVTLSA